MTPENSHNEQPAGEHSATNKARWNELAIAHSSRPAELYDVGAFKAGKSSLDPIVLGEVGDVGGKRLLHLMCHFGLDTLSWARLGATVTGADFSEEAIARARSLAAEVGLDATFVCTSIYELPAHLQSKFDVVFTSYGVLCWLHDLPAWGRIVGHFLEPGGSFHLIESHPFTKVLEEIGEGDARRLEALYPYWQTEEPLFFDQDGSYADPDIKLTNRGAYEWPHSMGEILDALISNGLRIERLREFPWLEFQKFPSMQREDSGLYSLPGKERSLPFLFSLVATKP